MFGLWVGMTARVFFSTIAPVATTPEKSGFLPPRWLIRGAWKVHKALYRWSGQRFGLPRPKPGAYGLAHLTTIGRRSGLERSVMIGYYEDGGDYVTMAMNGWGAAEPAWWLNLQDHPDVTLTLTDKTVSVRGSAAEGDERDRLWERWCAIDKGLEGYAARRPRQTAVVVLSPTATSS